MPPRRADPPLLQRRHQHTVLRRDRTPWAALSVFCCFVLLAAPAKRVLRLVPLAKTRPRSDSDAVPMPCRRHRHRDRVQDRLTSGAVRSPGPGPIHLHASPGGSGKPGRKARSAIRSAAPNHSPQSVPDGTSDGPRHTPDCPPEWNSPERLMTRLRRCAARTRLSSQSPFRRSMHKRRAPVSIMHRVRTISARSSRLMGATRKPLLPETVTSPFATRRESPSRKGVAPMPNRSSSAGSVSLASGSNSLRTIACCRMNSAWPASVPAACTSASSTCPFIESRAICRPPLVQFYHTSVPDFVTKPKPVDTSVMHFIFSCQVHI